MPIVDAILNSLVKYLQKKQKQRLKSKKAKKKKKKRTKAVAKKKKKPVKKKIKKQPARKASRKKPLQKKKRNTQQKKKKAVKKKSGLSKPKKKKVKKKNAKKEQDVKLPNEIQIGAVTHYFSKIKVIVLKMTSGRLNVGDKIHIKGRVTDFTQQVKSLQIESVDVKSAKKGQLVGLRVNKKSKEGDKVFKVGK